MEVNFAALMRQDTNTVKVVLRTRIPVEEAIGSVQEPEPVPTGPVVAPPVGNSHPVAYGSSGRRIQPAPPEPKSDDVWTFINTIRDLAVGDFVMVDTKFGLSLAEVVEVDEGVNLQPGDTVRYKYVVSKLDFSDYKKVLDTNSMLEKVYRDRYQEHVRKGFREQMLATLPADAQTQIQALLK